VTQLTGSLALSHCTDGTVFNNVTQTISFAIRDQNATIATGNTIAGVILPAGTTIAFSTSNGTILGNANFTVQNTNSASSAAWTYAIQMVSDASQSVTGGTCTNTVTSGQLNVIVTTPSGVVTQQNFTVTD